MEPVVVIASGDEQSCGVVGADAAVSQQAWTMRGDRVGDSWDQVVDFRDSAAHAVTLPQDETPTGHLMPRRCGDHGQDQRSLT